MPVLPDSFNAATYFIDRNVLEGRGERIAIECGEQRITYGALQSAVNRVGNALRDRGVRIEERVQLLLLDTPEFLYSFFGAIKIGAVAVPTNTFLKPEEYGYLLNDTRAGVLIVSQELLPQIEAIPRAQLRYLRDIVVVGGPAAGHLRFDDLLAGASPRLQCEATSKDDAAFWLYSSGSTGRPKGCVHLQHDMVVAYEAYAKPVLRISENDRCYSVARLFFAYGLGNAGYFPLAAGATTILSPARPTADSVYADIERFRPTLFFSVPTNYADLLSHRREGKDFDLSSVRHAVSAGESLPAALFHGFKQRFGVEILDALGSTESLQMVISNRPGEVRPGSSGKLLPGYDAKIVDENGQPVAEGEIGNLLIKADSTAASYWNQHEKSKATFEGQWLHTGDKFYQDEDGYFWYAGRSDDLFKVNGRWISPIEIEGALLEHPAVKEAAVVAREDGNGLSKPAAFIVLASTHDADEKLGAELQEWVAKKLNRHKRPHWVEFLAALPKTPTGKLQRFKLRQQQSTDSVKRARSSR